jgi:hypothetical protein
MLIGDVLTSFGYGGLWQGGGHYPGPCTVLVPVWTVAVDPVGLGFVTPDVRSRHAYVKNPKGSLLIAPAYAVAAVVTIFAPIPTVITTREPVSKHKIVKAPIPLRTVCREPRGVATVTPAAPEPVAVRTLVPDPVGRCTVAKDPVSAYDGCP